MTKNIAILGSTGSIGRQALDVVDKHTDQFKVVGLAGYDEVELLRSQAYKYRPALVVAGSEKAYRALKNDMPTGVKLAYGLEGLCTMAALPEVETVLISVSGAIGIMPTLTAARSGKRIALANKETLVAAGDLVMNEVKKNGVELLPVDSEHSAVFQCLIGEKDYVSKIWLTASGGPFRDCKPGELEKVTVDMALRHPNWAMGPKITIDSATLMNKGLEVIEAHHLFGTDYDNIQVIIHRESIVHSMIELVDGSFLAHMGVPDMRIPIQYALTYPERWDSPPQKLDFLHLSQLNFQPPDGDTFTSLRLAYEAGRTGMTMPAVLNAANEVAVNMFLKGKIKFTSIPELVGLTMEKHHPLVIDNIDTIMEADHWGREYCRELINKGGYGQ
ncbi:1-deoxy-D-xylulose-5-phosphate reductoisomerase [Syntrophomonas erecta]